MTVYAWPQGTLFSQEQLDAIVTEEFLQQERRRAPQKGIAKIGLLNHGETLAGMLEATSAAVQAIALTLFDETKELTSADQGEFYGHRLFDCIHPEQNEQTADFDMKMRLVARIWRMYEEAVEKKCCKPQKAKGNVFDPYSTWLLNFETTPTYWIGRRLQGWELLADMHTKTTTLGLFCEHPFETNPWSFWFKEKHATGQLFATGTFDMVLPITNGLAYTFAANVDRVIIQEPTRGWNEETTVTHLCCDTHHQETVRINRWHGPYALKPQTNDKAQ